MVDINLTSRLDVARLDGSVVVKLDGHRLHLHSAAGRGQRVREDVGKIFLYGVHRVLREECRANERSIQSGKTIREEPQIPHVEPRK